MQTRKKRHVVYKPNHPLADRYRKVLRSRYIFYESVKGRDQKCHWCKMPLVWKVDLCVDHLDSDSENDSIENLVPSCRGCNANRDDGTGYRRREERRCLTCGASFLPGRPTAKFCSLGCIPGRPKGTRAKHGTRARYVYGCRCRACKTENSRAWLEWKNKRK